jgi:hypothetical protein
MFCSSLRHFFIHADWKYGPFRVQTPETKSATLRETIAFSRFFPIVQFVGGVVVATKNRHPRCGWAIPRDDGSHEDSSLFGTAG